MVAQYYYEEEKKLEIRFECGDRFELYLTPSHEISQGHMYEGTS